MSDALPEVPTPKRITSRKIVTEQPVKPINAVEGPMVPQPDVDLVPIEQDFTSEAFRSGWAAALREVEVQWSHGSDGLTRFLATQKRLGSE